MRSLLASLVIWGLGWASLTWAADTSVTSGEAQPDWPAEIARLQGQLNRTPHQPVLRQQLAIAYNNYAVALADAGRFDDAIIQMGEAVHLDSASTQLQHNLALIHLKAAQEAYQARRLDKAHQLITQALASNPNSADAYAFLGEVEYNRQRLKEAKAAWEKALALDPAMKGVRERLAQVQQELPVESKFEKLSQLHFDIRYHEGLERSTGFDIQDALSQARREVGSDFAFWPQHKTVVIVYSAEQFRQLRQNAPEWAGGQYDGKIRMPLPGTGMDLNEVKRILAHEYTHALTYELTQNRLPAWFNEGLAEYEGWKHGRPPWLLLRQALKTTQLIPWAALSSYFTAASSTQQAALAYEQAHSIVAYLVARYSFWKIKRLLQEVANGQPLEHALTAVYRLKPARLEENWRAWLEEQLAASPAES